MPFGRDDLRDALGQLSGWVPYARGLRRTLRLDESEHAALTERIKVVADALQVRPDIRRLDDQTQITLRGPDGAAVSADEVRLAARIEDIYQAVRSPE